ncbi:DUF896 domain-containing protein [Anaerovorax odorimutans]|uniref:DUF896 domain-containing protein n=1 Tax=Anaerovorax odorimutans TaxID=109327 RepID=UPI0003F68DF6|nr:DUF896 domain-containing protein [Anaerovorax odorimutans]
MLPKEKLDRINELAKKSKEKSLTTEEKQEQHKLRNEYLIKFREHFKGHLDRIKFVEDEDVEKNKKEN